MNDVSDDDDDFNILDNAAARDSLALQAYLRERKLGVSKSESSPFTGGKSFLRSASPNAKATMNIEELENSLTVISPGLRVKTSFANTRGTPVRQRSQSPTRSQTSSIKRFDEGGGVYIEESTQSLRSMVKKSYEEKREYQQTIHEKQLEIEALKKSFLEMSTRCERLNMLMNRSKKVMLPSRISFALERWGARSLYQAFHRWQSLVSDYSTTAMKKKEDLMNRERKDWLTVRSQWTRKRHEMSTIIMARTVRSLSTSRLSKGFRKWFSAVQIDKSCDLLKILWIAPMNEKSCMKIMFMRWKIFHRQKKNAHILLQKVVSRLCFRSILAAWNTWKAQNRKMEMQQQKFRRAMSIINLSSPYARCLSRWRHYAFITEPKRLRLYSLLYSSSSNKSRSEQRQYFNSWKAKSKSLGMVPTRVLNGLKRSQRILAKTFFHKWSKSAKIVSRLQLAFASLSRCAKDTTASLKGDSFARWVRVSSQSQIAKLTGELKDCRGALASARQEIARLSGIVDAERQHSIALNKEALNKMRGSALRRMVLATTKQSTGKYFALWRLQSVYTSFAMRARRLHLLQDVATNMIVCGKGKISTAFRMWHFRVAKRRKGEKDIARFLLILKQGIRRQYFIQWANVAATQKRTEEYNEMTSKKMRLVVVRLLNFKLARGMVQWKDWLRCLKEKKSGANFIRRLIVQGSTRQCFMKWRSVVSAIRRKEHEVFTAMTLHKAKKHAVAALRRLFMPPMAVYIAEWKDFVRVIKTSRKVIQRLTMTKDKKKVQAAFLTWRYNASHVEKYSKSTVLLTRAFTKYAHNVTHGAFLTWKSFVKRVMDFDVYCNKLLSLQKQLEESTIEQSRLIAEGRAMALLSTSFNGWRQWTNKKRGVSAVWGRIMQSCIARLLKSQVFCYFNRWHFKVNEITRFGWIMKKSLSRLVYHKLNVAMKTWSRNVFILSYDSHINYLKHCSNMRISIIEADYIIHKMYQKWSRYSLTRRKNRSILKRNLMKMRSLYLTKGLNSWKSVISSEKKMNRLHRIVWISNLRVSFYSWKIFCNQASRTNQIRRIVRRKLNMCIARAWRRWSAAVRFHAIKAGILDKAMYYFVSSAKLRLSAAFFRLKLASFVMYKREGYSFRSQNLHLSRGNMKCMKKTFESWKMYSSTVLKSRGIEIMGCLENVFPVLSVLADVVNSEAEANKVDLVMHMDGGQEDSFNCTSELCRISTEMCSSIQTILPEYQCSVYVFDPETQNLISCDPLTSTSSSSPGIIRTPTGISPVKANPAGRSFMAGSFQSVLDSDRSRPRQPMSPSKGIGLQSTPNGQSFHSLHDFDDGLSEQMAVPSTSPTKGMQIVEVGPGGGDVGLCAQTGSHIVRRCLVSEALLYCSAQRSSRQNSPDKISSNPLVGSRLTPPRGSDRLVTNSGIFGRSLSKGVPFSGFEFARNTPSDEEDDYIYSAVIPIAWKGEVVGVVRLRSGYLCSPQMTALEASGFDVMSRRECLLANTEKQSWFLFSQSIQAASMQVYPVCMKMGLDVESACGLDTAIQLGGWAMRAIIQKDRRKKMLKNQLLMNPLGPTRVEILQQLESDKDRMHSEIQHLTSKLLETSRSANKLSEKSAKYKKFAESWKKRSECLQDELLEANKRIGFLVDKYGDVKRIRDSLQHITEETFAHHTDDSDTYDEFLTPAVSPMKH